MQLDTAYRRRKRRHDGPSSLLAPSTGCPIERPMGLRRLLPKRLADAEAYTPWHEINVQLQEGLDFRSACRKAGIAFIQ